MGVGRQSRRIFFGAKPDKGFLDKKISPYPEVVRGREQELTTRPSRGELVAGEHGGQLRLETTEGSGDWTRERRTERLAWIHGGESTPDTGTERRGDKIGSSEEESQDV